MPLAKGLLAEFEHEAGATRRMLERLPEEKLAWRPHEKSMTLSRLACHIAEMPQWAGTILDQTELDLATGGYQPVEHGSVAQILEFFDANVASFKESLAGRSDEEFFVYWKMTYGEKVVLDLPRIAALRGFVLSHVVHHRGQLSVYLRLLDVELPQVYGPTADDHFGA